jgi:hypothetical protein
LFDCALRGSGGCKAITKALSTVRDPGANE